MPKITAHSNTPTVIGWSNAQNTHTATYTSEQASVTLTSGSTWWAQSSKAAVDGNVTFKLNGNTNFIGKSGFGLGTTTYTADKTVKICTIAATYNGAAQAATCTASGTMPKITAHSNTPTVIGWSNAQNTHTATYTSEQANVTLTSGSTWWAQSKHGTNITITFYKNGASTQTNSSGTAVSDNTVTRACTKYNGASSCSVTSPTIGAASGFSVVGYNTSASSTTSAWNQNTAKTVSANANWYAVTKSSSPYTATPQKNISGASGSASAVSCYRYNGGSSCNITTPAANSYAYTNWTIIGWKKTGDTTTTTSTATSGDANPSASLSLTANTNIVAIWRKTVAVTMTFAKNGGVADTSSTAVNAYVYNGGTTLTGNVNVTAPAYTTRSGWTIIGYADDATNDHNSEWNAGAVKSRSVAGVSVAVNATSVTVASGFSHIWKNDNAGTKYTATLQKNVSSATGSPTSPSCTIATVYNNATRPTSCNITTPAANAYSLSSWTLFAWVNAGTATTSSATTGTNVSTSMAISGNINLVALWKKTPTITVTFDKNGGNSNTSTTFTATIYNGATTVPSATRSLIAPSCTIRSGYLCLGYGDNAGDTASEWDVGATKSISVPAASVAIGATTGSVASGYYHVWADATTNFDYTGNYQEYIVPATGWYKLETWGAQGGTGSYATGGPGGYSSGYVHLTKNEKLYVYVGSQSKFASSSFTTGYNGAGGGGTDTTHITLGGGGATDIRYFGSTTPSSSDLVWNSTLGLNSRVIVAGGGGGSYNYDSTGFYISGGNGGGLVANSGKASSLTPAGGGSQISGGVGNNNNSSLAGGFGFGGTGSGSLRTGGGSGYYGGGGTYNIGNSSESGGGGSSFISGYAGANAITSASNRTHTNQVKHYSNKYFIWGTMQSGVREGNGKARIAYYGDNSPSRVNTRLNNVRYIKDCSNGNDRNGDNHWVELQAIYNGVNIAKGKTVSSTSNVLTSSGTGTVSTIVNGDITSANYSTFTAGNQCVTVDLGQTYNLDEVAVWHYWADNRPYADNVTYVSSDNSTWTVIKADDELETGNGKRVSAYENVVTYSTLTVNPNGGSFNGSTSNTSYIKAYNTKKLLPKPTRSGYVFAGWTLSGGGSLTRYGNGLYNDETFASGNNNMQVYNWSGNGSVTHTRVASTADNPMKNASNMIKIVTNGESGPGLGGFYQLTNSAANKVFYHVIVAKIPVGYTLNWAANATGDGRTVTWLTDTAGTGMFETYIYRHNCGSTGTFETLGHVYLSGPAATSTNPVTWYVAYANMFDATGGVTEQNAVQLFQYGTTNTTLTANWTPIYTVNYVANTYSNYNFTDGGVTFSYDASTSILTMNGTWAASSVEIHPDRFFKTTITAGATYNITRTYVSGSFTFTSNSSGHNPILVFDITKNGGNLSTRNSVDMLLPTSGSLNSSLTVTAASVSSGADGYQFWFYKNSAISATFNNYKVKIVATKVYPSNSLISGSKYVLPSETPSRAGYTFAGWYTAETGGTQVTNSTTLTTLSNHTIYAHWTINQYVLDLNGRKDGTDSGNITDFGTADVYINGTLVRDDVSDFYLSYNYGTRWEIKDIKPVIGHQYDGAVNGTSGYIIGLTDARLIFHTTVWSISSPVGGADTLSGAVAKANAGATIKLLSDTTTDNNAVTINKNNLIINLNTKTRYSSQTITVNSGQTVTIQNGTLRSTTLGIASSGNLTLNAVKLGIQAASNTNGINVNGGSLSVVNSNMSSPNHTINCSGASTVNITQQATNVINSFGTNTGNHAIVVNGTCRLNIRGGKIRANYGNAIYLGGTNTNPLYAYGINDGSQATLAIISAKNHAIFLNNSNVSPTIVIGDKTDTTNDSTNVMVAGAQNGAASGAGNAAVSCAGGKVISGSNKCYVKLDNGRLLSPSSSVVVSVSLGTQRSGHSINTGSNSTIGGNDNYDYYTDTVAFTTVRKTNMHIKYLN